MDIKREIKFRVWDNISETMIYQSPDKDGLAKINHYITSRKNCMQYTGLKDKNGKEIYEGDIVEQIIDDGNIINKCIGRVVYHTNKFCICVNENFDLFVDFNYKTVLYCEVIGNIYENPELINKNERNKEM